MSFQVDISKASGFLKKIIEENVNEKESEWIKSQETKLRSDGKPQIFYLAFSFSSRFIRKEKLQLTPEQLTEADEIREGFRCEHWNLLQLVRTYFLLTFPYQDEKIYMEQLTKLFETADIDEQITLYSALSLLPYTEELTRRAAEGIRTNITAVFDAIALDNPYPHDFLDQNPWNQMVLKAVFMQRPLYKIYGADKRKNSELVQMLVDFARERWAANRKVTPELWRFVGPFVNEDILSDILKVVQGDPLERKAGLMALAESDLVEAQELLDQYPDIKEKIKRAKLNWTGIGKEVENNS